MPADVPRDQYDALDALNWSRLNLLRQSPAKFLRGYGDEETKSLRLGTAAHMAVLEPERFAEDYAVWKGKGKRGSKAFKAFETEAVRAGKAVLIPTEYKQACAMRDAVRGNPAAMRYLREGKPEVTHTWTFTVNGEPVHCKGRIDWVGDVIVDLKSTKDASPREFAKSVVRYGYHGQAAWYTDGRFLATGERKGFVIIAVENHAPYEVRVYRIPPRVLDVGRDLYAGLLGQLDWLKRNNAWKAEAEQEIELELPAWAATGD